MFILKRKSNWIAFFMLSIFPSIALVVAYLFSLDGIPGKRCYNPTLDYYVVQYLPFMCFTFGSPLWDEKAMTEVYDREGNLLHRDRVMTNYRVFSGPHWTERGVFYMGKDDFYYEWKTPVLVTRPTKICTDPLAENKSQ